MNTNPHSPKTKALISKAKTGIPLTQEHKDRISASMLERTLKKIDIQEIVERALCQPTLERTREVLEHLQQRLDAK